MREKNLSGAVDSAEAITEMVHERIGFERGRVLQLAPKTGGRRNESSVIPLPVRIPSSEVEKAMTAEQDGDASLFVKCHRNRYCFDHAEGCWYIWNEHYWEIDKVNEVLKGCEDVIDLYEREVERLRREESKAIREGNKAAAKEIEVKTEKYLKKINKLRKVDWKKAVLTLAASGEDSLGIAGDEWDQHPWLLGCNNGVVDLKTGSFQAGQPWDYIKTVCPIEWKGIDEKAPNWTHFIEQVFDGDQDLIQYIQRLFGYAITGLTTEHIMIILCGEGRNGKGTLLETLSCVLGSLAGPIQSEMLLDQGRSRSSSAPTPDIMALRGRRMVWASETNAERRLDMSKVKWLTGGDTLVGRAPYGKREVSFTPAHTLFLLTNHKPKVDPSDYALWQRLHLVRFPYSFVDNPKAENERQRDKDLGEKLKQEAPGILAWLVRGCLEWQSQGLNPPAIVVESTDAYMKEENNLDQFIEECCIVDKAEKVKAGIFYNAYRQWCAENGYRPFTQVYIGTQIKNHFGHMRSNGIYYTGLALIPDE